MTRRFITGVADRAPVKLIVALLALTSLAAVCRPDDKKAGGDEPKSTGILEFTKGFKLDEAAAREVLGEMTKEAHAFGDARQAQVISYLDQKFAATGTMVKREPFTAKVPNPAALNPVGPVSDTLEKSGENIYALAVARDDAPCVVALASHFDTKVISGMSYVGANDSGSSTVAVLALIAHLRAKRGDSVPSLGLVCDVVGILFDGEEAVLRNWHDGEFNHPAKQQDNTYGSRFAVSRLSSCSFEGTSAKCLPADLGGKPLVAIILMDMIGSPGIEITRDGHSSPLLIEAAAAGAEALGFPDAYAKGVNPIEDDHVPYRKAKVAALDLIDFNNVDYWHAPGDEVANLSFQSIELGARLGLYVALRVAAEPKVFLQPAE